MNLYALIPDMAANNEVEFLLAETDAEALEHGIFAAAHDACGSYRSLTASVYLVARDLAKIGTAHATDAPREWKWAHPGVEEAVADDALLEAEFAADEEPGAKA